jgi:hypothetical protein
MIACGPAGLLELLYFAAVWPSWPSLRRPEVTRPLTRAILDVVDATSSTCRVVVVLLASGVGA